MRLKRLLIRGFGQLRGEVRLEAGSPAVALLLEPNEAGKSTLAAAIVAALYGLESDRRRARGSKVDLDLHRPWEGGPYGLALTLEVAGRELVIDRDFDRDQVRVLDGARDVTDRFQQGSTMRVGESLTGLTREQFLLSTFAGQGDMVWTDPAGLTEALQRVADSQGGRATAAAAVEALDHALTHYDGLTLAGTGRVETEIDRCRRRIDEAEGQLRELDAEHARHSEKIQRLGSDDRRQRWFRLRADLLRVRRMRSEADALEEVLAQDDELRARMAEAEAEIAAAGDLDTLSEERLEKIEQERRALETQRRVLDREVSEADAAGDARTEAVAARDRLGLRRRPSEKEIDLLLHASHRADDAENEIARVEKRLEEERAQLATRGFRPDHAETLARHFSDLSEEDRLLMGSRTQTVLRLRERHDAVDEQRALHRREKERLERERHATRRNAWIFAAVAAALAAALVLLGPRFGLPPLGTMVLGGALVLIGATMVLRSRGHRRARLEETQQRLSQVEEAALQLTEDEAETEARWNQLGERIGVAPEEIEDRYREFRLVETHVKNLGSLQRRLDDLSASREEALASARELDAVLAEALHDAPVQEKLRVLREGRELYGVVDRAQAFADTARQKVERVKVGYRQQLEEMRARLEESGVAAPADEPLEKAFESLQHRAHHVRRLRTLRDETLPTLRDRCLAAGDRERNERRLAELLEEGRRLAREVADGLRDFPDASDELRASMERPLSQRDFDVATGQLREEESAWRRERETERTEVRAFLGRYESEAPRLREALELHARALRRAEEFAASVRMARDTLEEIGRETHRTWSAALNRHGNEVLRSLASRAQRLEFDEDLRLRLEQEGQQLTGGEASQHLSAGALDAVYLAARIAVSRFLSGGGEPLPLILDDPFANADDARLKAGVELLLDSIAPRQQVLLMACQASRYGWLRQELERPDRLVSLPVPTTAASDRGEHRAQG